MHKLFFNRWSWFIYSVLLLIALFSYLGLANHQPQAYQPYVSNSPSPTGIKGMYTYLEGEYAAVRRWSAEPQALPKQDTNHLLIMIEPTFVPTEEDMLGYRGFLEAGNTILLFSENPVGMFSIKVDFTGSVDDDGDGTLVTNKGGEEFLASVRSMVRIQENVDDKILLYDQMGSLAVKRSYGDGDLIIVNTPEWIVNGELLDYDHIPLVLSLIDEGPKNGAILFDEYVHGGPPTLTTLYPMGFLVLFVQGAFLCVLWLWYKGKRFGPILTPREETVRFSDERFKALAAWYLRTSGKGFVDSLLIQSDYIKLLMFERWSIPYQRDWSDISELLEKKWKTLPKEEIQPFLKDLKEVLEKQRISKREYIVWSKKLEQLRKGVEEG